MLTVMVLYGHALQVSVHLLTQVSNDSMPDISHEIDLSVGKYAFCDE